MEQARILHLIRTKDDLPADEKAQLYGSLLLNHAQSSPVGRNFSLLEQTRIRNLLLRDDLSLDDKAWLFKLVSRDDLSPAKDAWLNKLLLDLNGSDEQDPTARRIQGEICRLALIHSLQ